MSDNQQPGMLGGLRALAYGSDAQAPMGALTQLLERTMATPEQRERDGWLAFAGGIGANNTSGGTGLGSGIAAMSADRLERDKLMAQYLPLMAQALVQQQQMTLTAANASRDYLKDIVPKMDTQLAAMRTGDATPTYPEVVQRILQLGGEYQVPQHVLLSKINSLPHRPEELAGYLDRLAVAGAGADKLIPSVQQNAAGQTTIVSPVRGTMRVIGEGSTPPARAGANPTAAETKFEEASRGDVKSYEENLRSRVDAYQTVLARMNEQAEYVKSFQPGRYARTAGGIAAAVKDIGARLPGFDKSTVENLANKLIGAPEGSKEALAAQQLFEQLAQQETIAQLKTTLGEGQRMNQAEYQQFQAVNKGQAMDPATFAGLRKFLYTQAANETNRYRAWADYVGDPEVQRRSVTDFDARHTQNLMDNLLKGSREVLNADKPGNVKPAYEPAAPAAPAPKLGAPAPAAPAPKPGAAFNSAEYEPGARVGPTGVVYVIEKGVPRAAQRLTAASDAPRNGLRLSDIKPTLGGMGQQ